MELDTLGSLADRSVVVSPRVLCRDVDALFRADPARRSVVVQGDSPERPVLVNRASFYQVMTGPRGYGWAMFSAKPISAILPDLPQGVTKAASCSIVETGLELLASQELAPADDILVESAGGPASHVSVSRVLASLARSYAHRVEDVKAGERRFRALVQGSSDVIAVVDGAGLVSYMSPALERLTGRPSGDHLGKPALTLVHPEDALGTRAVIAGMKKRPDAQFAVTFRLQRGDGEWRWMEGTVTNRLTDPDVEGLILNFRDVTERRLLEDELRHLAFHDSLTGLPNRALISDRASQMLARARRNPHACAAMLIDLDGFKDINDAHGHSAGDGLLGQVAERLRLTIRASDTVGRLGGDEFVVLVDDESLDAGPEVVAERILAALRVPFELDGRPLVISASIGIAAGVRDSVEELLRDADIALYQAKGAGRNRHALFTPEMKEAVDRRNWITVDLIGALERDELVLHFQPTFRLLDGTISGVEALLRWAHPDHGLIAPGEFVPLLEENGQIVEVGRWVLAETCRIAAALHSHGHPLTMSVNVSPCQLDYDNFYDDVRQAIDASGLDPRWLVLEITETALMRDAVATARRLERLKTLGLSVAIDDFGTGYSSLAYLTAFPVDALKIDRSFIAGLGSSDQADAVVQSILQLGRALSLTTIAEGIEEDSQLQTLRRHGCDQGQGYKLAPPAPSDKLFEALGAIGMWARSSR